VEEKMPTAAQHVVGGAGMGGLLAAQMLAGLCAKVTIVERDALPDAPQWLKGARQRNVIRTVCFRGFP
jgi:2-polyprenyl-6-methoxyphenol hydroxylase-like FAD-dependent oxidoreductase